MEGVQIEVQLTEELSVQLAEIAIFTYLMLLRLGHMLAPRDPTTFVDLNVV